MQGFTFYADETHLLLFSYKNNNNNKNKLWVIYNLLILFKQGFVVIEF